jgi:hypothetical protein
MDTTAYGSWGYSVVKYFLFILLRWKTCRAVISHFSECYRTILILAGAFHSWSVHTSTKVKFPVCLLQGCDMQMTREHGPPILDVGTNGGEWSALLSDPRYWFGRILEILDEHQRRSGRVGEEGISYPSLGLNPGRLARSHSLHWLCSPLWFICKIRLSVL